MATPRGLVQYLDQQLHRSHLLPPRKRYLVGVSGGADSVALLRLLHAINQSNYWRWQLIVAHVDHGIRGAASKADAKFVTRLAKALQLECEVTTLRLGKKASEDAARQARLEAFAVMARKHRAHAVVLAHHADDQAETVLLRLIRGCGLDGLSAMQPSQTLRIEKRTLTLVRPLLATPRADLHAYLHEIHQSWREDQTNRSPQYARNRIRHEVLPLLESLRPGVALRLNQLAQLAGDAHAVIAEDAEELRHRAATRKRLVGGVVFDRQALRDSSQAVLQELLRAVCTSLAGDATTFHHLREAARAVMHVTDPQVHHLSAGIELRITQKHVTIEQK